MSIALSRGNQGNIALNREIEKELIVREESFVRDFSGTESDERIEFINPMRIDMPPKAFVGILRGFGSLSFSWKQRISAKST